MLSCLVCERISDMLVQFFGLSAKTLRGQQLRIASRSYPRLDHVQVQAYSLARVTRYILFNRKLHFSWGYNNFDFVDVTKYNYRVGGGEV